MSIFRPSLKKCILLNRNVLLLPVNNYVIAKPVKRTKPRKAGEKKQRFVDFKKVQVRAGAGGSGCLSFLREFAREYGGPDGGDGGHGGHVIFKASSDVSSLNHVHTIMKGDNGVAGMSKNRHGKNAKHTFVPLPIGTLVKTTDNALLYDLDKEGDIYIAARGGAGGHGNAFFLSNEVRAPTTYEEGAPGEARDLHIELNVIAHVGLVGFPNAGKSTLLRAVSRARPRVAAYPFTTLNPHIGTVHYADLEQVKVADIPGLIRGAHLNHGLGFSFLRHIQRCYCLLYVLDLADPDPWTQFNALRYELEQYEPGLATRPHAVIANKIDLPIARDNLEELKAKLKNDEFHDSERTRFFPISAMKGEGVRELLVHVREMYDTYKDREK